ncbi:S-layer homology domain-containing protein [Rothia nasimurium]|uniref:S-layer homology domain-containing protein n=1 Tax=Rothia nasimurium TaxID=85336 RepID=UPI002ADE5D41|nr:S-layer homology domain-containing protein [Rothia nasimurium]
MKESSFHKKAAQGSAAALLGLVLSLPLVAPPAQAYDSDLASQSSNTAGKVSESLANAEGTIEAFVQFRGAGAFESAQPQNVRSGQREPVSAQAQVNAPRFTDVQPGNLFYEEISWLAQRGISRGWSDGTFRPQE